MVAKGDMWDNVVTMKGHKFTRESELTTVTPKTPSKPTPIVVRAAHHQTPWQFRLTLLE